MENAKELLRKCDKNLTQIAHAVGYDRTAYFSSVFKTYTGIKPRNIKDCIRRESASDMERAEIVMILLGGTVLLLLFAALTYVNYRIISGRNRAGKEAVK